MPPAGWTDPARSWGAAFRCAQKGKTEVSYVCAGKSFKSLTEAKVFAELIFKSKGIVAGIEAKPKKLSKKAVEAAIAARIQRAVTGFVIPMMSIPQISNALKAAIAAGNPDERLKQIVAAFPGVTESV
jgi:hypothetical protein